MQNTTSRRYILSARSRTTSVRSGTTAMSSRAGSVIPMQGLFGLRPSSTATLNTAEWYPFVTLTVDGARDSAQAPIASCTSDCWTVKRLLPEGRHDVELELGRDLLPRAVPLVELVPLPGLCVEAAGVLVQDLQYLPWLASPQRQLA